MTTHIAHGADAALVAPGTGYDLLPTQALTGSFELETPIARSEAADPGMQEQRRQGFLIGNLALMIRYEDGRELTQMPDLYRLPNAPDWFCGLANLNGVPTPVFELAEYLGFERDPDSKPMLLVLSHGADAAGVVIDGLPERLRWTDADRADAGAAPPLLLPHQRGACLLGGRLWFDLECKSLLDALENTLIAQR